MTPLTEYVGAINLTFNEPNISTAVCSCKEMKTQSRSLANNKAINSREVKIMWNSN